MSDRALGGFDPHAGLAAHEAGQPQFNPVPSLLRSLLSEHLDRGYAAAAAERRPRRRGATWAWQALAALLIAVVFAAAVAQARTTAPSVKETQKALLSSVLSSEAGADALATRRGSLTAEVDDMRRAQLSGDVRGRQLLSRLDRLSLTGAVTKVMGPGMTVTLTDPGVSPDLTDVSKGRIPGSRQAVLDRDLQLVVNSLWAGGAEALAVSGVRIGPNVTIRQAGGTILVDNQPVTSPYAITAIGPPHAMADAFEISAGSQRVRLLQASYGVRATITPSESLTVPAGSVREVKYAKPIGG